MSMISTAPDVAIIIPTYNATSLLIKAIESILTQSRLRIEVIVIEDGSPKPSINILHIHFASYLIGEGAVEKDSNRHIIIRYIEQSNMGAYHARLNALTYCNSEYFKFLDQDDVLLPNTLEYEVAALKYGPDVLMSNWQARHYDKNGKELREKRQEFKGPVYNDFDSPIDGFLEVGGSATSAVLYRYSSVKDALRPVESFTPIKADDWLIFAQVCLSEASYANLDVCTYAWSDHLYQLSKESISRLIYEHYEILHWIETELKVSGKLTTNRERLLANYYAKQFLVAYEQDEQLFNKLFDKVKRLNPQYRMQHGNFIYKIFCNMVGLKVGVRLYFWVKQLKRFNDK